MRSETDVTENGLRRLLDEWDPIGVADEVPDEYDCMLAPLLQRLRSGAGRTEIGEFLRHELEHHFGLPLSRRTRTRWPPGWCPGGRPVPWTGPPQSIFDLMDAAGQQP